MKTFLPAALAAIIFSAAPLLSDDTAERFRKQFELKASSVVSTGFEFSKKTKLLATGDITSISGTALFSKPDRFLITIKKPTYQVAVSDGKTARYYSKKNRQLLVRKAGGGASIPDFNTLLSRFVSVYSWEPAPGDGRLTMVKLTGPEKDSWTVSFSEKDLVIQSLTQETQDLRTDYLFSDVEESAEPAPDLKFKFAVPRGTEVIYE